MIDKKFYRKTMLVKRQELVKEERILKSNEICNRILASDVYEKCSSILVYSAIKGEVALDLFIDTAIASSKDIFFPRVDKDHMDFFQIDNTNMLTPGTFGVLEPEGNSKKLCPQTIKNDILILLPGVTFSENGGRIGYGKGYYDRYIAEFCQKYEGNLYAYGVCFEFQVIHELDMESHDYPMDGIITEDRLLEIRK